MGLNKVRMRTAKERRMRRERDKEKKEYFIENFILTLLIYINKFPSIT